MECEICKKLILIDEDTLAIDYANGEVCDEHEYHKSCYDKSVTNPSLDKLKIWYKSHGANKKTRWAIQNLLGDMFGWGSDVQEFAQSKWEEEKSTAPVCKYCGESMYQMHAEEDEYCGRKCERLAKQSSPSKVELPEKIAIGLFISHVDTAVAVNAIIDYLKAKQP